jgi:hypothetical protein
LRTPPAGSSTVLKGSSGISPPPIPNPKVPSNRVRLGGRDRGSGREQHP